jgi:hypothetical protein
MNVQERGALPRFRRGGSQVEGAPEDASKMLIVLVAPS